MGSPLRKPETEPALHARGIAKSFSGTEVLHPLDLSIYPNELTLITGPSGSGKTTLLNILSGITRPSKGDVRSNGVSLGSLSPQRLTEWRGRNGQVFQQSGLLADQTVLENLRLESDVNGRRVSPTFAARACARLGIDRLMDVKAGQLSGGEAQRVALARAVLPQPEFVFADEPAASLDTDNTEAVHSFLKEYVDGTGAMVVMVSHEEETRQFADRVVSLQDGSLQADVGGQA